MDTEFLLPVSSDNLAEITILNYSPKESSAATSCIEITRTFQESPQLSDLFRYHLDQNLATYDFIIK